MSQLVPQWQAIMKSVGTLFPHHFKALSAHKADPIFVQGLVAKLGTNVDHVAAIKRGLVLVKQKVINRLQHQLKNNHYDLAQLVYNMNKLAGNYLLCYYGKIRSLLVVKMLVLGSFILPFLQYRFFQAQKNVKGKSH